MRLGSARAKAALPISATRIAKHPAISAVAAPTIVAGARYEAVAWPADTWPAKAARRVVSRITAIRIVALLPAAVPHPANLMLVAPALANRKITPIAAEII